MGSTGRQAERTEAAIAQALDAALELFSGRGYGTTSMRDIAEAAGMSVGNLYHHFGNKEEIFQRLIDAYWERLLDPDLRLNQVFRRAAFPEDLEELAAAIEEVVDHNGPSIMLIYVDVVEFDGVHIRSFYESMPDRFEQMYGPTLARRQAEGELGAVDPLVAVMVATRWLFYFFSIEKCFGAPMHFGMDASQAVDEFIKIMRYGVLPRSEEDRGGAAGASDSSKRRRS